MVRYEELRADNLSRIHALLHGHGVGLVHGQECNGNAFQGRHFRDVFRVSRNIYKEAFKIQHKAVVAAFGMEHRAAFGVVVGRYGCKADPSGKFGGVAVRKGRSAA